MGLPEAEAYPTHRLEQLDRKRIVDFSAQACYLHIDHIIDRREAGSLMPDIFGQHLTRDRSSPVLDKVEQQVEFARSEFEPFSTAGCASRFRIECQVADHEG